MKDDQNRNNLKETYDKRYVLGDLAPSPYFANQFRRIVVLALPQGTKPKILDLGGGTGQYSLILQELGYDVTLMDISEVAVQKARELGVNKSICVDFRDNSAGQDAYDIILSKGFSLLNTSDIKEFNQVLRRMETLLIGNGAILFWSTTDQSETWGTGRWFNFKLSVLKPCFDRLYLFPALRHQLWMPEWLLALITFCCGSSPALFSRPLTLIGIRRARRE